MGHLVPLDLAGLRAGDQDCALADLRWPTHYDDYGFLSGQLIDDIVAGARAAAHTPELEAVVEAKLYDVVTDLAVIARLTVDLRNTRASGGKALYDRGMSAWLRYLDEGADSGSVAGQRLWHYRKSRGAGAELKRRARRWRSGVSASLFPTAGRCDVLSRNKLLDEFLVGRAGRQIDASPNYRDWTIPEQTPAAVHDLVEAIAAAFAPSAECAAAGDTRLAAASRTLAQLAIAEHIAKAWVDLRQVCRLVDDRRAGDTLVGGTPKHIGRLFAWRYKQLGRTVLRFAHGGERAFYDDYPWALAELPFVDQYFCHGRGEAARLAARRDGGRMARAGLETMEFRSYGSKRHQSLRAQAERKRWVAPTGTVMYVAGGYLGEELSDFPSRKPPDVLYYEWQVWLLETLRSAGYRTVVKVHPKGVLHEARLLQPFCDETVLGHFHPDAHDVDCYLFDFAGAAFFDALASNRGIVLIDMGVRPPDPVFFGDLEVRCEIVPCTLNERNLFRADRHRLAEATETASSAKLWHDSFFETYFHA